jgi:hypothetical protein
LLAPTTQHAAVAISDEELGELEASGAAVISDGEQTKPSFATYPVAGLKLPADGVVVPFADDTSTSRETAFSRIRSRVEWTALALAARALGV